MPASTRFLDSLFSLCHWFICFGSELYESHTCKLLSQKSLVCAMIRNKRFAENLGQPNTLAARSLELVLFTLYSEMANLKKQNQKNKVTQGGKRNKSNAHGNTLSSPLYQELQYISRSFPPFSTNSDTIFLQSPLPFYDQRLQRQFSLSLKQFLSYWGPFGLVSSISRQFLLNLTPESNPTFF